MTDVQTRAREVTEIVAATLRIAAEQEVSRAELYDLAQRIGTDWDDTCCPLCEETLCDDRCPLAGIRAQLRDEELATTANQIRDIVDASERVAVKVMLTVGDDALLVTPDHSPEEPLRMPAAPIAADAGIPMNELPGREFTAVRTGDGFGDFRLLYDPRS